MEPKVILENKDMLTLAACQLHINLYMLKGVGQAAREVFTRTLMSWVYVAYPCNKPYLDIWLAMNR